MKYLRTYSLSFSELCNHSCNVYNAQIKKGREGHDPALERVQHVSDP